MSRFFSRGGVKDWCLGKMNKAISRRKPLRNDNCGGFSTYVGVRNVVSHELEKREDVPAVDYFCLGQFLSTDWCLGRWRGRRVTVKVLEKDSPLALMAVQNFKAVINMTRHPVIPIVFDALEGRKYSFFVTELAQGTLRHLIWLKHPKHRWTDERESFRDGVLDEELSRTSFWDGWDNPQPPLYGLFQNVLSAVSHMSNQRLLPVNLKLENVLVYPIEDQVYARLWPLEARERVDDDIFDIMNKLGHMFFELITGGLKFEGDLTVIEKFPHVASFMRSLVYHDDCTTFDQIIQHPLFWNDHRRLNFIASFSNWIEYSNGSNEWLRHKMQILNVDVLKNGPWALSLPQDTQEKLKELGYNLHELSDLIRLLYDIYWSPDDCFLQGIVDVNKENFYPAITKRFPNFVHELYNLAYDPSSPPEFSSFIKKKIQDLCET